MSDIAGSLVPMTKQQAMVMLESVYLLMDLGQYDSARELGLGAAALMPKSEVPQIALGTLEFSQQKYDKALQTFRTAQRLAPKSALPRAHCGEALQAMGKFGEAMKELIAAAELEPKSDGARFAVAVMLVIASRQYDGGDLEASLKTMQAAIKADPKHGLAQAHYGKVLVALDRVDEGLPALKKAVELDPHGDGGALANVLINAVKAGAKSAAKAKKK